MNDVTQPDFAAHLSPTVSPSAEPEDSDGLLPVDPAYTSVLRISIALGWLPIALAATLADRLIMPEVGGPYGLITTLAWLLAVLAIVIFPSRRYAHIGYALGADDLRVARGFLFRTDTIVPFVRVQHIDVGQGPVERRYGLSHLVVHTSGTHNSTVTLPGLPADQAAAMRETIRQQIQTDFA
jgi:uncharacterized protein